MFWERFSTLCAEIGKKPQSVRFDIEVSSPTISRWKEGAVPNKAILKRISDFFEVSEGYLLGYTDDPAPPAPQTEKAPALEGEEAEKAAIDADTLRIYSGLNEANKRAVVALIESMLEQQGD